MVEISDKEYKKLQERVKELEAKEAKRKRAEEALKESEEKFRTLVENAPIGIYYNDIKGNFLYGNKCAEKIIGYRKEELMNNNFLKAGLLSPKDAVRAAKLLAFNNLGKSTGPDVFILNTKDGSKVSVEINTQVVRMGDKKVVLGMVKNITEHEQIEEERHKLTKFMTDREDRIIELKDEVNRLLKELGRGAKYKA